MSTKEALRVSSMKRRAEISSSKRTLASLLICQKVFDSVDWQSVTRVNSYQALDSLGEVVPQSLIDRLSLEFPAIEIVVSPFRVDADHPEGEFDIVIVPLVAFDKDCNRIGMGGGWYDGYFAAHPNTKKIGLAFETQKVPAVPISPIDVPLDMVVTETKTYSR